MTQTEYEAADNLRNYLSGLFSALTTQGYDVSLGKRYLSDLEAEIVKGVQK